MKKNITYPSSDGKTMIHAVMWLPEGETVSTVKPRAIVPGTWNAGVYRAL